MFLWHVGGTANLSRFSPALGHHDIYIHRLEI